MWKTLLNAFVTLWLLILLGGCLAGSFQYDWSTTAEQQPDNAIVLGANLKVDKAEVSCTVPGWVVDLTAGWLPKPGG
jgi:hypothetical protein